MSRWRKRGLWGACVCSTRRRDGTEVPSGSRLLALEDTVAWQHLTGGRDTRPAPLGLCIAPILYVMYVIDDSHISRLNDSSR